MSNSHLYPNNLKMYVMIDVLNWKTREKSYEDRCKRFGKDEILKPAHKFLFNRCMKETRFLLKAQTNINEIIFNESMYLRYLTLRDAILRVSIFESYREVCTMMEGINYPEFEFWYYRFYNGQRDWDYDRSNDPMPLEFSDLPIDVTKAIVEKLEIKPRYILRGVSRDLRSLVDSSILRIEKISFVIKRFVTTIDVDDVEKTFPYEFHWDKTRVALAEKTIDNACTLLDNFIKNPKLQLGSLAIQIYETCEESNHVIEMLKSLPHQLRVRNLKIRVNTEEELMDITRCMKPKILKKIDIEVYFSGRRSMKGLFKSEQLRLAEEISFNSTVISGLAHFFHFKSFDIPLMMDSMEMMLELRNGISKSSNFEWCRIKIDQGPSDAEIQRSLELKKHVHNDLEYFVYNIPNFNETLVFSFFDHTSYREIFIKKSTYFVDF